MIKKIIVTIFAAIFASTCSDMLIINAHSDEVDIFGEPISEPEVKNNQGKLSRIGWTILYSEVGFFLGLGIDRSVNAEKKYPGIASGVGGVIGGVWGYLLGNKRDREKAIQKINRSRRRLRISEGNLDGTLRRKAMIAEAIEANMGSGYRWGYSILGLYIGMGAGSGLGYGLHRVGIMVPGGSLGILLGVSEGYLLGEKKDKRVATEKAHKLILKSRVLP